MSRYLFHESKIIITSQSVVDTIELIQNSRVMPYEHLGDIPSVARDRDTGQPDRLPKGTFSQRCVRSSCHVAKAL
jgi:hypothetical protein